MGSVRRAVGTLVGWAAPRLGARRRSGRWSKRLRLLGSRLRRRRRCRARRTRPAPRSCGPPWLSAALASPTRCFVRSHPSCWSSANARFCWLFMVRWLWSPP